MTTDKRIVLITGANTGLGLEIVKALFQSDRPYHIILGGRSFQKAETAVKGLQQQHPQSLSSVEPIQIDVEHDDSIQRAFEGVGSKHGKVDVLINNAGAQFDHQIHNGEMAMREAWNRTWNVNVTGTQIVTFTFAPLLLKSSDPRLIFITSGTATLTEHENRQHKLMDVEMGTGWPKPGLKLGVNVPAYRSAKTGMNMMMREWARILHDDGVKVWCISPGFLATGIGGDVELVKKLGALDPAIGGQFVRDVVEGARDADAGKVIRRTGIQPW